MKALLMYRDRDFTTQQSLPWKYNARQRPKREVLLASYLWNAPALAQDLELDKLLYAMAGDDDFVFEVAQKAIFTGLQNDRDTVLYRQAVLRDALKNKAVVRELYGLLRTVDEETRRNWWGLSTRYPSTMLYSATDLLEGLLVTLRNLRKIAEAHRAEFESEGFIAFFRMLERELGEEYLDQIQNHLKELRFRKGVLLSAELGESNESVQLTLREPPANEQGWFARIFSKGPPAYTFHLAERDEAGGQIISNLRHRGITRVALAVAQSADHVLGFLGILRTEVAFYVACLNLHDVLTAKNLPTCFPLPQQETDRKHAFQGLHDISLALSMNGNVVSNTANADGKSLIIVTGANQGGKSSFLRSLGLAQMMMQCGMFVAAEEFSAGLCTALFTHYKREEDTTMKSGKFDEELARINEIVEHVVPNALFLFNESFAATNEREGSEIAEQIVRALLEKRTKIFYVTHLFAFASHFSNQKSADCLFLRAERKPDGVRTFRIVEGGPLETSYGEDLYHEIFAAKAENAIDTRSLDK
jgi:hypothetical protein